MWSSEPELNSSRSGNSKLPDRRAILSLLLALPLAACGFEPALAPGGTLSQLQDRIAYAEPESRLDFVLKGELQKRLGQGNELLLAYDIRTQNSDVGITPDQVITRQQITGTVVYNLTNSATGLEVMAATETAFTSFGTTGTTASTAFAQEAAYDRLMVILADRIMRRLALTAGIAQ